MRQVQNHKQNLLENHYWENLHLEIKKDLNNGKFSISNTVRINLNSINVKYCSIFTIVHEMISPDDIVLIEKSHFNARFNLNSLDSRVFIIKLNNGNKITLEVFIDVNSCETGEIVEKNTNIDEKSFLDYEFITKMPCYELATNELDVATEIISNKLTDYFRSLWTVMIVSNADYSNTMLSIKTDYTKIHISNYAFILIFI